MRHAETRICASCCPCFSLTVELCSCCLLCIQTLSLNLQSTDKPSLCETLRCLIAAVKDTLAAGKLYPSGSTLTSRLLYIPPDDLQQLKVRNGSWVLFSGAGACMCLSEGLACHTTPAAWSVQGVRRAVCSQAFCKTAGNPCYWLFCAMDSDISLQLCCRLLQQQAPPGVLSVSLLTTPSRLWCGSPLLT